MPAQKGGGETPGPSLRGGKHRPFSSRRIPGCSARSGRSRKKGKIAGKEEKEYTIKKKSNRARRQKGQDQTARQKNWLSVQDRRKRG